MSERLTLNDKPPLVTELENIDIFNENVEASPASLEELRSLQKMTKGIVDRHLVRGGHYAKNYRHVEHTSFLREGDQPDDAPRFRAFDDPDGELAAGRSAGVYPTISFRFDQGKKTQFTNKLDDGKKGSWDLSVDVIERDGQPMATITGGTKTGGNKREVFSVSAPVIRPA